MNKLLILSAMAFFAALMPIVPAMACFPESEEILFTSSSNSNNDFDEDYAFTRAPLPMSFCESGEGGFVIVKGKCYDQDAITDFDDDKDCEADEICSAYREEQRKQEEPFDPNDPGWCPVEEAANCDGQLDPDPDPEPEPIADPNHGEIKGDEELTEQDQNEEEHQEEEEQGEESSEETTAETDE